ncbi:NADAR family protein [Ewingella americana]|uniref:N-glycosidase YbiA n=1 Tax=Ewingella americana TaxID=41202 RepID=A0A502GET6_9GAMM|nr:NADAR family protein [Ewingella americana]TPG60048.1 NADAR family protein [Ewingella americana]
MATVVPFFHRTHPLSNWYPRRMFDPESGITFATIEHWMMWHKAKLFNDESVMALLASSTDPYQAKKLGRAVKGFVESVWVANREDIVKKGLYLKVDYCDEALYFLLDLDPKTTRLCEASPWDRLWGVGLDAEDPRVYDPDNWKGLNLLGNLWQELLVDVHGATELSIHFNPVTLEKILSHKAKYPK